MQPLIDSINNMFQSTLPRRERLYNILHTPLVVGFNPRSREGSDPFLCAFFLHRVVSIHAPAKGATPESI